MARLSQKAWNNVIIFAMLAMILMLNLSSFKPDDSDLPSPIIEEGAILLSLQINQNVIERAGQTWRLEDIAQEQVSSQQLAILVDNWQRALLKPQSNITAEEFETPDHIVVLWLAGERNGRVLPIKTIQQQTYIMFNDEAMLLDFPTVEQLIEW